MIICTTAVTTAGTATSEGRPELTTFSERSASYEVNLARTAPRRAASPCGGAFDLEQRWEFSHRLDRLENQVGAVGCRWFAKLDERRGLRREDQGW